MVEPSDISSVILPGHADASGLRQVTVRQGVVGSTIIAGDGNVVTQTVTIVHQYSRAEQEAAGPAPTPISSVPNPYRGLEAFYEEDADHFFGRKAVVDTLWHRLRELQILPLPRELAKPRLLAIIGPSGSGKSSVARAGLVPELARRPIPELVDPRVAVLVPHADPIEAVANVLARLATNDPTPAAKCREFADEISRVNRSGVPDGLHRVANILPGADRHKLLLLVDQFEEVFTSASEVGLSLFIETLLDAASHRDGQVSVVLTLRSDFLSATARYPALDAAIAACSELVPAMSEAELKEAISLPAELAAKHAAISNPLDPGTVELLVKETIGREGALPLLQFALHRIWEGLAKGMPAAEILSEIGGVGGALAVEANRLLDDLAKSGKEDLVRRAFLAMVQLGEGVEDTRRRARLSEIVAADETPEEVIHILRRFARPGERLVTFASDRGETTLEVTHEQLIASWPTLRGWLRDWRDDERFRRRLVAAAKDWLEDRGSLWGPTELELMRRWRNRPGQAATPQQQDFVEASEAALRKQQQQARRATILMRIAAVVFLVLFLGTAALAVGLVGASVEADERSAAADAAASEATRQVARAQVSVSRLENERGRRFEAASAAFRGMILPFNHSEDLSQTKLWVELVRAYSADEFLAPPLQHSETVRGAAFDPTGGRVVTASFDGTARIWDAANGKPIGKPLQHTGWVRTAAFDTTGERVVTASTDHTARIWSASTGEPIGKPLQHADIVRSAAFDPEGERVVTASADTTARIWDAHTGEPIGKKLQHAGTVFSASFDPKGERVVTASGDDMARIWDVHTGKPIGNPLQHAGPVWAAAFDPTAERVVTASGDSTARLWDARTGMPVGNPLQHAGPVYAAVFDPKGERVVTASGDSTARLWDARTGKPISNPLPHAGPVYAATFDPKGERVVTASLDGTARIWDTSIRQPIGNPLQHRGPVYAATFDPKGERVITASSDSTARIWDVRAKEPICKPLQHAGSVYAAAFDPTGERVITASEDMSAQIWDAHTGEPIGRPLKHEAPVTRAVFDFTGDRVVTVSGTTVRIWGARTGESIGNPLRHAGSVHTAAFDPTGERVVTASSDGAARIWSVRIGEQPVKTLEHSGPVWAAAFDGKGERVVTASSDSTARIWDARTGEPIGNPLMHAGPVYSAAFDPKGKLIITTSSDSTARIWDVSTGVPIGNPLQHGAPVYTATFDPTGERVLTASFDGTVRIWDVRTGGPIGKTLQHSRAVYSAAFDPKGELVLTVSEDNVARIWDANTGQLIGKPLQHARRVWAAVFDAKGERVVTASDDMTARIWLAPRTGQAFLSEVLAVLDHRAPEPLKVPGNASQRADYGHLMVIGVKTLLAHARSLFRPS
jgi:WD40 repeat protein